MHAGAQTAESTLQQVIADYERFQRQVDPVTAGQEGDREALRRLPDVRPAAEQAQRKQLVAIATSVSRRSMRSQLVGRGGAQSRVAVAHGQAVDRGARLRLRSHPVPERQRLPHAGRLPRAHDDHRVARGCRSVARAARGAADVLRAEHREPAARRQDALHAAANRRRSRARGCAQAGRRETAKTARSCCRLRACRRAFRPRRKPNIAARRSRCVARQDPARRSARSPSSWHGVRAGGAAGTGLAHDAERRGQLSLPGAPRNHDGPDAGRDPSARAGGSRAHSRPDGADDRARPASRAASPSS